MEILMTQLRDERSQWVADTLRAGGHAVTTCDGDHGTHGGTFASAALRGDDCPVDSRPVDLAVHVPEDPDAVPGIEDEGVLCALRQHIPLIVVADGAAAVAPEGAGYVSWAAAVCGPDTLESTLVEVAAAPLELHTTAATEAANDVLEAHGVDASYEAVVRRVHGRVHVELVADRAVPSDVAETAAVRAHDAVRLVDEKNLSVDVSTATPVAHLR